MPITLAQNFYKETVAVAWTTGGGNFYVSTKPTISSGYLVISPNSASLREIVKFTATGTDGTGDYVTITAGNRGLGGTTEQAHAIGEAVYINITAETLQEISDAIDQIVAGGAQNASTTVKGIAKLSTAPASPTEPIAVGDNDPRLTAPAGMILMYGGASAPSGYLSCDGSAVSRTTYASLFSVISTTYGIGDGATTFNVPNLRGRFALGYSSGAPTKTFTFSSRSSNTITVTGADNHAHNELQTGQAVFYNTTGSVITGLTNNTTYYVIRVTATSFQLATSVANANAGTAITLTSDGSGTQTFVSTFTARPMGQTGGEETHALTDAEMPSHLHDIYINSGGAGSNANMSTVTASSQTSAAGVEYIVPAGSDVPANNMPLFTVVNYIIKT